MYNGLPLCLFRFYPEKDKLENIINQVLNIYENYVEVKNLKDEKRLKVIKKLKLTKDFKVYNFAYMISTLMYDLNLISSQKKEVKINEVENLTNSLFKFDERFKNRINIDIHNIRRDLKDKEIVDWKIYNEIIEKNVGEPDERNFLAHSGFEKNLIELKKDSGELWIRYLEKRIDTVKKFCQKGLK